MARGTSTNSKAPDPRPELEYTRLHITPLNPALLQSILPQAVLPLAQNISYHSIQTFPEKDFGFVDLPAMEAQKIKKRLNGSILKGTKVRVEEARPLKQVAAVEEDTAKSFPANKKESERPLKRRRTDTGSLQAVELQGRKVKRGWTDPTAPRRTDKKETKTKGKKDTVKSKYTSNPECLFKTAVPANVAASLIAGALAAESKDRRKRKKKDKEIVVHEFSKTVKHATFLRSSEVSSTAKGVNEFVDDQGWVDEEGNVIEVAIRKWQEVVKPRGTATEEIQDAESSSDSDESSVVAPLSDSEEDNARPKVGEMLSKVSQRLAPQGSSASNSETSSSGTSSSGTSSDEDDSGEEGELDLDKLPKSEYNEGEKSTADTTTTDSGSTTTPTKLKLAIPKTTNDSEADTPVHPLEALFKRRRPDLRAPKLPDPVPSFTFFDAGADENEDSDEDVSYTVPMTPFTRQDLEFRGHRSAAPTPDTAYPGKPYDVWPTGNPSNETDEAGGATPTRKGKPSKGAPLVPAEEEPVSDFQKWFYEHRGEANRAWKRRRKLVAKEKRQRENRKKSERVV
jgi:hypothetical protein